MANVTEGEPSDTEMTEGRGKGVPKDHHPQNEIDWRHTRPCGIDYKEDSSKLETRDMCVRLGGENSDLAKSQGGWNDDCVNTENGQGVVLSYSYGSVQKKLRGHRVQRLAGQGVLAFILAPRTPGNPHLPSGKVELLYTLRYRDASRSNGWIGEIHHRLDNEEVVLKSQHLDRGFIYSHDFV